MQRETKFRAWDKKYEIGDDGSIWSLNYNHTGQRKQMKTYLDDDGYPYVFLTHNTVRTKLLVHRAVALLFLPPQPTKKHQVNHKDRNRQNADVSNLEWVTAQENVIHSWANGRVVTDRHRESSRQQFAGAANPKAKLDTPTVRLIRERREQGESLKSLASVFKISPSQVSAVARGVCWK